MFGSLRQSVNASFEGRFLVDGEWLYFRPLGSRRVYQLSKAEADQCTDNFGDLTERADLIRSRSMKAIIPSVICWALLCLLLRKNVSSELFGETFYIAIAMGLMIALPTFAYGQFWFVVLRDLYRLGRLLSRRPSIDVPIHQSYRTTNPFQFALRWTALLALGAFIFIGGILPETSPDMALKMKPWISFEIDTLLIPLGVLYGLSMLWNWLAARRAGSGTLTDQPDG